MAPRPTPRAPGRIPRPRFGTALRGAGGTAARRRADRIPHRPPGVLVARFHRHPRHPHPASRNRTPRRKPSSVSCHAATPRRSRTSGPAPERWRSRSGTNAPGRLSSARTALRRRPRSRGRTQLDSASTTCRSSSPTPAPRWRRPTGPSSCRTPPMSQRTIHTLTTGDVRFEPPEALVSGPRGLTMLGDARAPGPSPVGARGLARAGTWPRSGIGSARAPLRGRARGDRDGPRSRGKRAGDPWTARHGRAMIAVEPGRYSESSTLHEYMTLGRHATADNDRNRARAQLGAIDTETSV